MNSVRKKSPNKRAEEDRPRNSGRWPFAKGPTLGECIDAYHREHAHRRKASQYYITEALNQFMSMNAIQENFPMISLEKHHCKVFKGYLLDGKIGRGRKPGPVTIKRKLSALHHFIKWAVNNEHMDADIMAGLALPARLMAGSRVVKEAFTDAQLSQILKATAPYRDHEEVMRREWYWVVLLLMHSGCRALEIIQLLKVNVKQTEGVWSMEMTWIGAEGERQLKNNPSVRTIPLHSGVIRAGVLDWIEQQPGPRLFPSLFPYGAIKTTQWFSAMLEKQGLKRPELTLHSLRHSVAVALEKNRTHPSLAYRLMGHGLPGGVHATTYLRSLSYPIKELSAAIEKITFPAL